MRFTPACLNQAKPIVRQRQKPGPKFSTGGLTHITSEKLCDDVLELLKPSLPRPHTCDIIDLNPGRCLWSRKLNEFLKPRRHVLVEPRLDAYADHVNPLLSAPNTSYRYAPNIHTALNREEGLLSEDNYNFQDKRDQSSELQYAANDNLLLTGNLSGAARLAIGFIGSEAKQFLHDYYRCVFAREDFIHRYGLVRFLPWIGEDARRSIVPTTVNCRTKQSVQLEAAFAVEEVAGPSQFEVIHNHQKRWHDLDVENQQEVRRRQRELGFVIPAHRHQPDPLPPFAALKPTIDQVRQNQDLYPHHQTQIQKLLELDSFLTANDPDWYTIYDEEVNAGFRGKKWGVAHPPKYKEFRLLMNQLRTQHNTYRKVKDFIWEQRQLARRFDQAYTDGWFSSRTGLPVEGSNEEEARKLIHEDVGLHKVRQGIKNDTRRQSQKAGDDYRCYDAPNRIMAWNRRQYEPLLVQSDEFHVNKPLTLLDLRPKPKFPAVLGTVDEQICFDYVCTALMIGQGDTVAEGIRRLVPVGEEAFIDTIPGIRDTTKGGWWNLDRVRTRAMHHDLFVAIAKAFCQWPDRPPLSRLMSVYKGVFDETIKGARMMR